MHTDDEDSKSLHAETCSLKSACSTLSLTEIGADEDLPSKAQIEGPVEQEANNDEELQNRALTNLMLFSILLFTVPFIVMFFGYKYFIGRVSYSYFQKKTFSTRF